jgi:DNA-binding winged helix-turn-helix (wHTH) protein
VGNFLIKLDGLSIPRKDQHKGLDAKVMKLLDYILIIRNVGVQNELLDQLWKNQVLADDALMLR